MQHIEKMEFIKPKDMFSAADQRRYSYAAQRLFCGIYHTMARHQQSEVAVLNKRLIERANIPVDRFENVQRQLVTAGLLEVTFDERPGFAVEAKRTVYRWPEQNTETT